MVLRLLRSCVLVSFVGLPVLLVAGTAEGRPEILVSMLNRASVDDTTILVAEKIVSLTYEQAGLSILWKNCPVQSRRKGSNCIPTVDGHHLVLSIEPRARTLNSDIYGVAFLGEDGSGSYCDVFYDRIAEQHHSGKASVARILAIVAAHELGHLLLGSHSHSPVGLMRPQLLAKDFSTPELGATTFSPQQAHMIVYRLQRTMVEYRRRDNLVAR